MVKRGDYSSTLQSKAAHFVSDITTVFFNPISDANPTAIHDNDPEIDGPDTSSFTAFLYSLLSSSSDSVHDLNSDDHLTHNHEVGQFESGTPLTENGAMSRPVIDHDEGHGAKASCSMETESDFVRWVGLPDMSEPSVLLSDKTRGALYSSLPALVQGRKWVLLYSTWRHGISLSSLYRRSMLWPGLSLLVVGDRNDAIFGGLVEAPLRPSTMKKYQGTNSTFVFTNTPGGPVIFRPTGVNRYFTLCSPEFLAMGGGGHFALYLDGDLLTGSSSVSDTYGNSCLAHSESFEVKEVELWGFVYTSKYEEIVELSRTEAPGICRW